MDRADTNHWPKVSFTLAESFLITAYPTQDGVSVTLFGGKKNSSEAFLILISCLIQRKTVHCDQFTDTGTFSVSASMSCVVFCFLVFVLSEIVYDHHEKLSHSYALFLLKKKFCLLQQRNSLVAEFPFQSTFPKGGEEAQ